MDLSAKAAAARMKAFIDAHLEQPVTLQQLAALSDAYTRWKEQNV